jgi:[FeFe] hydrogenase H-cluster maturation GTPase HydF
MTNTPRSERVAIAIVGLRNAGKSSLANRLLDREVSIVSEVAGTTTDPVSRPIELGRLGPAVLWDTAGIDDEGELGALRVARTREVVESADAILFVTRSDLPPAQEELRAIEAYRSQAGRKGSRPFLVAATFADVPTDPQKAAVIESLEAVAVDNLTGRGAKELRERLIGLADLLEPEAGPFEGLVHEGDLVLLVTPIDLGAPKGRLILPQVESIRDLLDKDCAVVTVKERELGEWFGRMPRPRLVVTDSQAFSKVAADIPEDQSLTSFSILFARKKGDIGVYLDGVAILESLRSGGRILMLEACSHHRQADDLGTVKIPRLFRQLVPGPLEFEFARELPPQSELARYSLVVTCGSCMRTRREVMVRLDRIRAAGIGTLNYGIFLAWANGLLPRAVEMLPEYALLADRLRVGATGAAR